MKVPKACRQCRVGKRRCTRGGPGEACDPCKKRNLACKGNLRQHTLGDRLLLAPRVPGSPPALVNEVTQHNPLDLPPEVAQELVNHYLEKIHDRPHSLFHPSTLITRVRKGTVPKALLYALCAMGTRFSTSDTIRALEAALTREARRLLLADLDTVTLETIQACIIVANINAANRNHSSEALFFRIAHSMAEVLGLTWRLQDVSILEQETRRRIWWSLYMADHWCFSGLGLPRHMKDLRNGRVDLAMDECVFRALTSSQKQLAEPWKPGLWAHMTTLVQYYGPIEDLNRQSARVHADAGELDREVAALAQELDGWVESLPLDMQMTKHNLHKHQERGTGGPFVALHLGYHHYSTLLYYRYLEDQSTSSSTRIMYIAKCKLHSKSFSELLRTSRQMDNCAIVYPTAGHMAAVSSSVLVHTLLFGELHELEATRDKLNANFEALVELKVYWPTVSHLIDRLVMFQNICLLSTDLHTHRLDGWMVRFLIEHSLPLEQREMQVISDGIDMESETMASRARKFTEQGRYTSFNRFSPS